MSQCYKSYKKRSLIKTGEYLLKQPCCDSYSCSELAKDLEDLQYKCNDTFGEANMSQRDAKGNIEGTLCSSLRDKKIELLNRFKSGGRRRTYKRKIKKLKKTKNTQRNKKKSRKTK
jgi:hypothetical protein